MQRMTATRDEDQNPTELRAAAYQTSPTSPQFNAGYKKWRFGTFPQYQSVFFTAKQFFVFEQRTRACCLTRNVSFVASGTSVVGLP